MEKFLEVQQLEAREVVDAERDLLDEAARVDGKDALGRM